MAQKSPVQKGQLTFSRSLLLVNTTPGGATCLETFSSSFPVTTTMGNTPVCCKGRTMRRTIEIRPTFNSRTVSFLLAAAISAPAEPNLMLSTPHPTVLYIGRKRASYFTVHHTIHFAAFTTMATGKIKYLFTKGRLIYLRINHQFSCARFHMLFGFPPANGQESAPLVCPHCRL